MPINFDLNLLVQPRSRNEFSSYLDIAVRFMCSLNSNCLARLIGRLSVIHIYWN